MKYLVISLGTLGRAIAVNLAQIGHEVIGVDQDMHRVETVKDRISGAVCLDSTDKVALNTLPLNEMDATFICFGKDFGTSVQTIATLKSLRIDKLIVRSISDIHETVVKAIGVTEIMTPEQDYANVYASQSILGGLFKEWFKIADTHHIYKMAAPHALTGQKVSTILFEENFNVRLAGIERPVEKQNLLGLKQTGYKVLDKITGDTVVEPGDILILFGKLEVLKKLAEL
ncbi:MAG: TrkA family potassium uptake protein [Tannerellaceae bacterium]|nr:TrkA family potassium uptake protein [Tannerellaceae bacterium]